MRYMGGKSRIRNEIANLIERERESNVNTFVSLFCGSCSIESKVNIPNKILNDNHYYLIEMWKGLQNGRVLPEVVTDEEYYYIKEHTDEDPCLTGLNGICRFWLFFWR